MKLISDWFIKISSCWLVIITLLVMAGFMAFILPAQAEAADRISGDGGSPDLSFSYPPEELYQMADSYGSDGRKAYIRARWTFDLIFPVVYVVFLTAGISWFLKRINSWPGSWKLTNLLPLLAGVFDLLENTGTSLTMAVYPARQPLWLLLASIATPIKWVLLSASFGIYFVTAAAALLSWIKDRRKKD